VIVVGALALCVGGAACSMDIFDVAVDLQGETFVLDFGAAAGTIPDVPCDPAAPACTGAVATAAVPAGVPADVTVSLGCDAATARCFAQADARAAFTVDVLDDGSFQATVDRRGTTFVRVADVAYTIPANTLTFDVPEVQIFVGPASATRETDDGVVFVDSIRPVPAGAPVTERRHVTVPDGSAARDLIEQSIQDRQPFVFVVTLAPRVDAGAPVPAGMLEIDLFPSVVLGLPR
jgi:hypothetical protein